MTPRTTNSTLRPGLGRAALAVGMAAMLGVWAGQAALAGQDRSDQVKNVEAGGVIPVVLEASGEIPTAARDRVIRDLRAESPSAARPIVVLIHGFNETRRTAGQEYDAIVQQVRQTEGVSIRPIMIGLYWNSGAGSRGSFMLRGTGHRLATLLGMPKAVRNPYLEKRELAARVGEVGLRPLLIELRRAYPSVPVHVVTHSLGAQVLVSALADEEPISDRTSGGPTPRVDVALLAGADLDYDIFVEEPLARAGLQRIGLLWVTVPEHGTADGVLELRRGAGKADALGNRGLSLPAADAAALLNRRGLLLDVGNVPAAHGWRDYFNARRIREWLDGLAYLADADSPAGANSILAAMERVAAGAAPDQLPVGLREQPAVQLYAAWRNGALPQNCIGLHVDHRAVGATSSGAAR